MAQYKPGLEAYNQTHISDDEDNNDIDDDNDDDDNDDDDDELIDVHSTAVDRSPENVHSSND